MRTTRAELATLRRRYARTADGELVVEGTRSAVEALAAKGLVRNVRSHPGVGWLYAIATLTAEGRRVAGPG